MTQSQLLSGAHVALECGGIPVLDGFGGGFRTAVVAVGARIVAGIGLYYTHRNFRHSRDLFTHTQDKDREAAELTREGQMTDRYATAINLLGAKESTKQLGGIYALERIMRDSPKDHATVVEVLAAFIRENADLAADDSLLSEEPRAPDECDPHSHPLRQSRPDQRPSRLE